MPRRAAAGIRPIDPDPMYGSKLVQQVINKVMIDGKKSTAEQIVYDALDILAKRTNQDPVPALEKSIKALTPIARGPLPPRRRRHLPGARRGAAAPRPHARRALARRVLALPAREDDVRAARRRAVDAQSQQGGAFKRKDDIYRMAQANKAFAHYRW